MYDNDKINKNAMAGLSTVTYFTITAEMLARSFANFYCQFNKLTSVFYASVLLLMINRVITLSK